MNDEIEIIAEGKDISIDIDKTLISPILQNKEATPTKQTQTITNDVGYNGLSQVTINPIPDDYIIPTGEISISVNGNYNVKNYETANVNIPITKNAEIDTNVVTNNGRITKEIVSTPPLNTSGATNLSYFFSDCYKLKNIGLFDTSSCTNMSQLFLRCYALEEVPAINTSSCTNMSEMFR